jgi:hypothetical protein
MALTTVGLSLIIEQTVAGAVTGHIQTQILLTGVVLTGGSVAVHITRFVSAQLSGPRSSQASLPEVSHSALPSTPPEVTGE